MTELCGEDIVVSFDETEDIPEEEGGRRTGGGGGGGGGAVELGRRLLAAARDGDTAAVLEHMARGAPFTTDWLGTSPLHLAAANNRTGVCGVLLRAGVSRDCRTKVERTPLHLAAYWGHTETAELLIQHGADVHCRDMLGMTALHWAVERGHVSCARALLRAGASPLHLSRFHTSPLSLALSQGGEMQQLLESAPLLTQDSETAEDSQSQSQFSTNDIEEEIAANTITGDESIKFTQSESQDNNTTPVPESVSEHEGAGARLLRAHGITLLPPDTGGTALSALRSGRTILLSDAGKLMLKESGREPQPPPPSPPPATTAAAGVVLTATPITSPPRGVKIFTLNTKETKKMTIKKIVNPTNSQVKYVALPPNISPSKVQLQKAKVRSPPRRITATSPAAVKLLLNKGGLKFIQTANKRPTLEMENVPEAAPAESTLESVVLVPEQWIRSTDVEYLRGQLLATQAALHRAKHDLNQLKKQLAE